MPSKADEASKIKEQLVMPLPPPSLDAMKDEAYPERLKALLTSNLDFHNHDSSYATHGIHPFPAKFPPQLPRLFIENLTYPNDVVLDPMAGSGTTILEAYLFGRRAIGLDIDPLALRIISAKVCPVNAEQVLNTMHVLCRRVEQDLKEDNNLFLNAFRSYFDKDTLDFITYWFSPEVYKTLFYLKREIEKIEEDKLRLFFEIAFSSVIITKNGGVSLALDLAHTRPHRAKIVYNENGTKVFCEELLTNISSTRLRLLTKTLRPVLDEFKKRVNTNLRRDFGLANHIPIPQVINGDAQSIPLKDESVDLIITSPPYASNAIDYMRAHKFSLVWFGYSISELNRYRRKYIGHDGNSGPRYIALPPAVRQVLESLERKDEKKMKSVQRYYSEMRNVLSEMYRVLRPGKAAILVVGTSVIRGIDIQIDNCLAEIGRQIGFNIPAIGVRNLDRDRRMLPAGNRRDTNSQIEHRIHREYVIGFYKPLMRK